MTDAAEAGAAAAGRLEPRHQNLMPMLVHGVTPAEAARELEIAKGTARKYASAIYRAFGVHSQREFFDALA